MTDPILPETRPAWASTLNGRPGWAVLSDTESASWLPVEDFSGGTNVDEVGYDQGGYGEGGYDSPSINYPRASRPNWTIEVIK